MLLGVRLPVPRSSLKFRILVKLRFLLALVHSLEFISDVVLADMKKTETRLLGLDFGAEKPLANPFRPSPASAAKTCPGYADDNGTPSVGLSGQLQLTLEPLYVRFNSGFSIFSINFAPSVADNQRALSGQTIYHILVLLRIALIFRFCINLMPAEGTFVHRFRCTEQCVSLLF